MGGMWKVLKPVFKRGYRHGVRFMVANIAAVGIGASVKPAVPDVFLDNTEELSIEKIENLLYK